MDDYFNTTTPATASTTNVGDELYDRESDYRGAMIFIVITLCVYSLGITAFVAGHIYRRTESKIQEMQISDYLSSMYTQKLERIVRLERIHATTALCRQLLQDKDVGDPQQVGNNTKIKTPESDSVLDASFCENVSSKSGSVEVQIPAEIDRNEVTVRSTTV